MNNSPGRSAAGSLITVSAMMRMFWGMSVDYPVALNAVWICPLLGLVISLPLIFSISQAAKFALQAPWQSLTQNSSVLRLSSAGAFALLLLYDAAVTARLTASSSNIIALGDVTVHFLILPLSLVIAALVLLGLDAAGNSARIALRILPIFLLVLLVVQLKRYRIAYLTPVLGNGIIDILSGAVYCAGVLSLVSLIWFSALPDRNSHGLMRYMLIPSIAASIALAGLHMSFPIMPNGPSTRAARIELILSNGRMSLSPQFLLNILWYGGLLYLLAADVLGAAVYLRNLIPKLPARCLALAEMLIVSIVAVLNPTWLQNSQKYTQLYFPIVGAMIALLMLAEFARKRGKISCKNA